MKRHLLLCAVILCNFLSAQARELKISVIPSEAKIYIDGSYYGDGTVNAELRKKDGFIAVKVEHPGYLTLETKIYATDKRKAVSYTLKKDESFDASEPSDLVNKYFNVKISKKLYKTKDDGTQDLSLAWKLMHQIILGYFEEIQTTDFASGFIQTPWIYKTFPTSEKQLRTRVSVRQSSFGDELAFQIKISSEVGSLFAEKRDESFKPIDRILKNLEPMISEFQSRLKD